MTRNEIAKMAWDQFKAHPDALTLDIAAAAVKIERQRIVEEIKRSARGVDAGVSKPDLWALAQYIEKVML
jgi:hypothetical protein